MLAALQGCQDAVSDPDDREWLADEVGAVLRIAGGTARSRMVSAADVVTRLPGTLVQLTAGVISPVQARELGEAVSGLADDAAAQVEARVLARAGEQTNGQFRVSLRRAVIAAAPVVAEQAHARAVGQRRVRRFAAEDGMSILWALLATPDAIRIETALNHRADALKDRADAVKDRRPVPADPVDRVGEFVRVDQRRADALVEFADRYLADPHQLGPAAVGVRAQVAVTVALSTLLSVDDAPGELAGYGPIPASMVRALAFASDATWRRLVTDPVGRLIDYGKTRYRPPKSLAEFVRARSQTCAFPTCSRPAQRCELDHARPWADDAGPTCADNLVPLCSRHHHLKHETTWAMHYEPTTGTTTWTSPTGRTYTNTDDPLPTGAAAPATAAPSPASTSAPPPSQPLPGPNGLQAADGPT